MKDAEFRSKYTRSRNLNLCGEGHTMFYYNLTNDEAGRRTAERLLALRRQLAREGPPVKGLDSLLLGTWNIREFDSLAYGPRLPEAMNYIAEIISHFDLVAIQEVREDLSALERIKQMLGDGWHYVATDVTEGRPGNRERMAFIYDTRKVRFGGLAGEIVIPPVDKKDAHGNKRVYEPSRQLYRTPFICGFRAGWAKFMLCTVHIVYGKNVADSPQRSEEIRQIANFLAGRIKARSAWSSNLILLGDFNIFKPSDITMQAITDAGFEIPAELQQLPTSTGKKRRFYDQVAFAPQRLHFDTTGQAGVFDFYQSVFRDNETDFEAYKPAMGPALLTNSRGKPRDEAAQHRYYRSYWRTHQMSDHLPMWVELKIDFGEEYLRRTAGG